MILPCIENLGGTIANWNDCWRQKSTCNSTIYPTGVTHDGLLPEIFVHPISWQNSEKIPLSLCHKRSNLHIIEFQTGGRWDPLGSDFSLLFFFEKVLFPSFLCLVFLGFPKWNPKKILFWPESSLSDELFAPVFTKWLLENGIGLNQGHINWIKIYNNNKLKRTLLAF